MKATGNVCAHLGRVVWSVDSQQRLAATQHARLEEPADAGALSRLVLGGDAILQVEQQGGASRQPTDFLDIGVCTQEEDALEGRMPAEIVFGFVVVVGWVFDGDLRYRSIRLQGALGPVIWRRFLVPDGRIRPY